MLMTSPLLRRCLLLLVAASAAFALSGCGGDDGDADLRAAEAEADRAAAEISRQVDSQPPPEDAAPADAGGTGRPAADPVARQLRAYLKENFGGALGPATSWYGDIKGVSAPSSYDGVVEVRTDLYPDADADAPALAICNAIVLSGIDGVAGGKVLDSQGGTITECP